jgi:hypothetical protein
LAWNEECSPDPVLAEHLEDAANSPRLNSPREIMLGDFAANVPIRGPWTDTQRHRLWM